MYEIADHLNIISRHHLRTVTTVYENAGDKEQAYHLLFGVRGTLGPSQPNGNIGGAKK
jgi:hypothetical protein